MENDCKNDCCFTVGNNWFRYRAAAVIIENGCVLLASNETSDYYYSVGGGVHFGESAEEAVVREVFEETGVEYEIDRLAFVHENFFRGNGMTEGLLCHEIALYFLMKPKGLQTLNSDSVCAEGREYMNWVPIGELGDLKVFPRFFAEKLIDIPGQIEHIVSNELASPADNGEHDKGNRSRFRTYHCTAKPASLVRRQSAVFCGGSAPAPPASSKEQEGKSGGTSGQVGPK